MTLGILAVLSVALAVGGIQARDGRLFFGAMAAWAGGRAAVSLAWRDDVAIAGLSVGGLIAVIVGLGFGAVLVLRSHGRAAAVDLGPSTREVGWADPETRPRF